MSARVKADVKGDPGTQHESGHQTEGMSMEETLPALAWHSFSMTSGDDEAALALQTESGLQMPLAAPPQRNGPAHGVLQVGACALRFQVGRL